VRNLDGMIELVPTPVAVARHTGRPVTVDAGKLDYTRRLRDDDGLTLRMLTS